MLLKGTNEEMGNNKSRKVENLFYQISDIQDQDESQNLLESSFSDIHEGVQALNFDSITENNSRNIKVEMETFSDSDDTQEMENHHISDQNSIPICTLCQMTFPSYEEILVHTCVEIKDDKIEEIIGHSEIIANDQLVDIFDQEDFENKSSFSCLDLTEEFLIFILKQVEDLCENIKTGDPDIERRFKVNQNLNNAVAFYRSKLDLKKQISIDTDYEFDEKNDISIEVSKERRCCEFSDCSCSPLSQNEDKSNQKKGISRKRNKLNLSEPKTKKSKIVKSQEKCCPYCGKKIIQKLEAHIDSAHPESGEKKFKCDECSKGFIFESSYRNHKYVKHKKTKGLACETCDYKTNRKDRLEDHIIMKHNTNDVSTKLVCEICGFSALTKIKLIQHMGNHHRTKNLQCPYCEYKTYPNQKLHIHIDR